MHAWIVTRDYKEYRGELTEGELSYGGRDIPLSQVAKFENEAEAEIRVKIRMRDGNVVTLTGTPKRRLFGLINGFEFPVLGYVELASSADKRRRFGFSEIRRLVIYHG